MNAQEMMEQELAEIADSLPEQITEDVAVAAIRAAYLRGYVNSLGARPEAANS